ncbi:ribokinase [Ahrensia kielensis]|uniref:ribokinase n=1 Tax=Ahrensia kielensis TaxID=76980 RepID=UPI001FE1BF92|nr:ribokinase [Ahrensia kielensis]
MTVVVVGSINFDLTMYLDRWPKVGETVTARESASSLGGKGANQCIAATRLSAKSVMIGAIGNDGYGLQAIETLERENVILGLKTVEGTATGIACIDVGPEGDNIIRLAHGANAALCVEDIAAHASTISEASVLLLQNEIPLEASLEAARLGRSAGALVIMDPAPMPEQVWDRGIFSAFDLLTPNITEAERILQRKIEGLDEAMLAVSDLSAFARRGAIITMGGEGVVWHIDGLSGYLPAVPVDAIDTVAAGDCFNGALAAELTQNVEFPLAIEFAVKAASITASRKGAQISIPTRAQVDAFKPVAIESLNNARV